MMKININIYIKKYGKHLVGCLLNLITTTNRDRSFTIITNFNLEYFFNFPENSILSRINQDRYYLSQLYLKCVYVLRVLSDIWHTITISNNQCQCLKLNYIRS